MGIRFYADLALLIVTAIWGSTFIVVKEAISCYPTFSFLSLRFFLAVLSFLPLLLGSKNPFKAEEFKAGFLVGLFLFAGYAFQTMGLRFTTASKAGFITGLSVVIVPILSALFLSQSPPGRVWLGAGLAALGLAFLSLRGSLIPSYGDLLVLVCAVAYAAQIVALGKFAPRMRLFPLTFAQLLTVMFMSTIFALIFERPIQIPTSKVIGAALFTGIPATSLAFGVQTFAQRYTSPSHAALIFSAEPVFAALFAFLIAGEVLGTRELLGCLLILGAMLLAEM
ncbi:MAG: DMT family transporter [Anaerolineae bacterium]|nr:DMT family transporter [Anaerolineae bacterium]MDW8101970.1 DMT family transporter [Anaerolineae bacterium]